MCSSTVCITWLLVANVVLLSPNLAPYGEAAGLSSKTLNDPVKRLSHLSNYEVIMPTRLDPQGLPLPTKARHFHKRSASTENWYKWDNEHMDQSPQQKNGFLENATYVFEAFGETFHINLTKDNEFISPSFVLEVIGNGSTGAADTESSMHCFYSGSINGHPESSAVLSLCLGMYGLLETHNGSKYFVEPLQELHKQPLDLDTVEEGYAVPHVIYPSDAGLKNHNPSQRCGLTDDDFSKNKNIHHHDNSINERWNSNNKPLGKGVSGLYNSISKRLKEKELLRTPTVVFNHSRDTLHHRSKRQMSYEQFVELMVVADSRMVQHHDRNVQHYILTLVALVNRIFRDPSIGNSVNIVLVKLLVLERDEDGPRITSDAPNTLHNFCIWQQSQNPSEDEHPHHYDTAVLLTRQDICRSSTDCDTLGLAELGTMCDPHRSCSIVEDNGLSASFTMAHELGHVFNLPHDDNYKCRELKMGKYAVMAPTLNYHTSPWTWSECSRRELTEFLDLNYGNCLLDKPTDIQPLPSYLPGEVYNVSKQCELVFGGGSTICPYSYMRNCKRLWCRGSSWGSTMGCRTQHMPWADGTPCASNSWCYRGECMKKNVNPQVTDGSWGSWGPYSDCTRSCGGGIRQASRECESPAPENGGKYCIGTRTRFRSCNIRHCPDNTPSFRELQCQTHNGKHYNINGLPQNVRWEPKYNGVHLSDQCKLICKVSGSSSYYQLGKKVKDGTPCSPDKDDICIQGSCMGAGCDHILNSNTRRDKCGVCGGDDSSCKTVEGRYNEQKHGYNEVVTISKGARKIEITQESYNGRPEDQNYLAIMNHNTKFVLNGEFVINLFEREIRVDGTLIKYSGSGNVVEKITSNDVLNSPITVFVLSAGDLLPPQINYTYNVPIDTPIYMWDIYGKWGSCTPLCGGTKTRAIACKRAIDRLVVPDEYCRSTKPEPIVKECNTKCGLGWEVTGQNDCSSQCGSGRRNRHIQCIKRNLKRNTLQIMPDQDCASYERLPEVVACQGLCEQTVWKYAEWSPCSKTCGSGLRRRSASCRDSRGRIASTSACDRSDMHVQEVCNTHECPNWQTGEWSSCSVTCGLGQQQREVACYVGHERRVDNDCETQPRPEDRQSCQHPSCPFWQFGAWGTCSVTCGIGYQHRAIRCRMRDGQMLEEGFCNSSERPIDTQDCHELQCPESTTFIQTTLEPTTIPPHPPALQRRPQSLWRKGSWTTCTSLCGSGTRKRYVSCRDIYDTEVNEEECSHVEKPSSFEVCNSKPCPQWRTGEWNQCPVTCGQGVKTRYVACVYSDNVITNDVDCELSQRPMSELICNMHECFWTVDPSEPLIDSNTVVGISHWRTGPWSTCSRTCRGGWQRRLVLCQNEYGDTDSCDTTNKPADIQSCNRDPCPQWNYGEWGPCPATCEGGFQRRIVICMLRSGQTVNDTTCDMDGRPEDTQPCNTSPCRADRRRSTWQRGPWTPCSVTCGAGVKRRAVTCQDEEGRLFPDKWCEDDKPVTQRSCKRSSCAKWDSGEWSGCSATCGKGQRVRQVRCVSKNKEVEESQCVKEKPLTIKGCRRERCSRHNRNHEERAKSSEFSWKKGKWGDCSKSCGEGYKNRHVYCIDHRDGRVQDDLCASQKKPREMRACNEDTCDGARVDWMEGYWSECSTPCGMGQETRSVTCQTFGEDGWPQDGAMSGCNEDNKPMETKECNYGDCSQDIHWIIGGWSECSKSCGSGIQKRKVQCRSRSGKQLSADVCGSPAIKPKGERLCRNLPCQPSSCQEVKEIYGTTEDKEYTLLVQNRSLSIYCYNMASSTPIEFISLLAGETENFSEIYPKRLIAIGSCPYDGNRNDACECIEEGHSDAGLSTFTKVRLNLQTLEIIITDSTFANTRYGRFVPYGMAGDCYSSAECPQGRFQIDLTGTGLTVAQDTSWEEQGSSVTIRINRIQNNKRIAGQCGGDCGKCLPDRRKGGLRLTLLT